MASTFVPLVPKNLGHPPVQWSAAEVKAWLKFCVEEFSLSPVCTTRFDMNGKALCLLTRTDFIERAPHAGDVLHNVFQKLRQQDGTQLVCHPQFHTGVLLSNSGSAHTSPPGRQTFVPILPQPRRLSSTSSTTSITATSTTTENGNSNKSSHIRPDVCVSANSDDLPCIPTNMLSPAPSERSPSDTSDSSYLHDRGTPCTNMTEPDVDLDIKPDGVSCPSPLKEDGTSSGEGGCRLLWEFVYQLLQDPRYAHLVCWESETDLTFRINNQAGLADLWGQQKNKDNMTYEKLSRALRYYYKMNIIKKVQARRLTYKFLQHPTKIKRGQRGARPHASRIAAEQQGDVAQHVTSSSAPGLHGDSPGYEEGEEDTKALNVTLVETVADSTGSAQSFTTSENSYSEVTFSDVASCSAQVCVESPSPQLSIEPALSLPVLLSSSISVGSNISTLAGDIPSPLLSTTPLGLAGNHIASGPPEGNDSNFDSAASIHLEKEPDPRLSLAADTSFDSRLQQDSVACHYATEGQQEQANIHIKVLKIDERSDDSGHIPEDQNCVENSGPETTHFPYEDNKCTLNTSSSSRVEDDELKSNQHEQGYSTEQNPNLDGIRNDYRESASSHQLLRSPEQRESCPSPLVYTELTPKQNTTVSKSQSLQISPSYPVTESFGSTLVQLVQHNSTAAIDRIQDLELGQNESQQPLFQAHAISNNHLLSYGATCNKQSDAYHYRPILQHNEVSVMLPRPSTPYLKSYQRQEVHENGNDLDCRSEFSIDRKFSPCPAIPTSSYSHSQSETTQQLHVSVSQHSLSEKRKADELVELCNTYPAHQKRQCLAGRTASPSITQYFPHCHSIHHRHSPARPVSQPEFRQSVLPLAHAHSSHERDHKVSFTDWAMSEFGARDHRKSQSYENENWYGSSSLEVMDLSKPNKPVKFEHEQEQPEDLSMKAKSIPAIL